MNLENKTAIVTGAAKGIGAAIAQRLASDGAAIIINYARDEKSATSLVRTIKSTGGRAIAVQGDVTDSSVFPALFDSAEKAFGPVDILVNNAGVMHLSPLAQASDEDFNTQVAVNLGGTFRGMREAGKRLREGGRIISISSSVVGLYQPGYGIYAATKAAIEALTHVLAKELGSRGITVNAISPGPVETAFFLAGKTDEQIQAISRMAPLGRLGQPDDIAHTAAFLAGPDSGWINGQTIRTNGGVV